MSRARSLRASFVVLLACAVPVAARAEPPAADAGWGAITAWQGDKPVLRVETGRPDAATPGRQVVGVDDAGRVILVRFDGAKATATELFKHGVRLIGLAIADVDPAVPGEEIYAGGFLTPGTGEEKGKGGVVFQVVVGADGAKVREVWRGGATQFVHAIGVAPAGPRGRPAGLVIADYAGIVSFLAPAAAPAPWTATTLHEEPADVGVEDRKAKEVQVLATTKAGAVRALVLMKGGRAVLVDVDAPRTGRVVLEEAGGLSRACDDGAGGAYVCGYEGRVVRLVADGDALKPEVVYTDPAKGLRGVARGTFPCPSGAQGTLAVYGYAQVCRVLVPGTEVRAIDVFRDTANGHGLVAAELVAGNGGDELVVASYSNRIVVLTPP